MELVGGDALEKVRKSRPNLKESSILSYERNLKKIHKILGRDDKDWMLNVSDIILAMNNNHVASASKRAYYATLLVFLPIVYPDHPQLKQKCTILNDEITQIKTKMTAQQREQKMSEKEKTNWITWKEVEDFFESYYLDYRYLLMKKAIISAQDKEQFQRLVLLAIFTQQPPRRSSAYENMKMETEKSYKLVEADTKYNYLVIGTNSVYFVFNNYKTSGTYGQQIIPIEKCESSNGKRNKLIRILKTYKSLMAPTTNFLFSHIQDPTTSLNADAISKKLKKIFMTYKKKAIGSSMLRHIYISHKYSDPKLTLADKDKIAECMGHSQAVASEVYHKIENSN